MSKTINIGGDTFEVLDITDVSSYPRFVIRIGDNLYAVAASYFDASGNILTEKKTFDRINTYHPWMIDKVTYTGFKTKSGKRITISSYQSSNGRISLPPDSSDYMKKNYPDTFNKMTELPREIANADWSSVVKADGFFDDCSSLENITGMYGFKGESISFRHCNAKHIPIINGENLTSFSAQGCGNLEEIHFINFTEPKANIMNKAPFNGCANMKKLLGFNFRNQNMNTGDALYHFSVKNNLRNLTIDCTNIDTFGKTPCINIKELGFADDNWKFTLINVPTKFKGKESDLISVAGIGASTTVTNTYHIINFLDEVVIEALTLTDAKYKMSDLYPARYQTIAEVPDKLDTSKLTTAEEMFQDCKKLTKLPDNLDFSNVTNMKNFLYNVKNVTTIPNYVWNTKATTYYGTLGWGIKDNLTSLGTSTINLSSAEDITGLFFCANKLTSIPTINLPKVKKMSQCFEGATNISDFSKVKINSNVEDMASAFNNCTSMQSLPTFIDNKINKIKQMRYAFSNCKNLIGKFPYDIDCSNIEDITKQQIDGDITVDSDSFYLNEFPFMNTFKGSGITSVNFINVDEKYKRYFSKYSVITDVTIDGVAVDNKINVSGDNFSLKASFGITELKSITSDFTFGTVNNLANMFVNQQLSTISLDGLKIADGITSISAYHMFTRCGENGTNPTTINGTIDFNGVTKIDAREMFGYNHLKNDITYNQPMNTTFNNLPDFAYSKIINSMGMFAWCLISKMSEIQNKLGIDLTNPKKEHFILCNAENMFYGTQIQIQDIDLVLDGSRLSIAPNSMFDYSNISKCKIVNIPQNIDLNSFKNCRNDGEFMNLQVAHDTSTFTTVF